MRKNVYERLEKLASKFEGKLQKFAGEMSDPVFMLSQKQQKVYDKLVKLNLNENFVKDLKSLKNEDGSELEGAKTVKFYKQKGFIGFKIEGASDVDASILNKYFNPEEIKKITGEENIAVRLFNYNPPNYKLELAARPK